MSALTLRGKTPQEFAEINRPYGWRTLNRDLWHVRTQHRDFGVIKLGEEDFWEEVIRIMRDAE